MMLLRNNPNRAFLLAVAAQFASAPLAPAAITCSVPEVRLRDAYEGRQLLVSDGGRDVTREAKYTSANPAVARVDAAGYVTPAGDGGTVIRVERGADRLEIPVPVTGFAAGRAVDFRTEVQPLLSKLGCNAGGCHGKASGQNGFKLSLFGFDTAFDYAAITREARGRRVFPAAPEQSLFLLKATGRMPHGGGRRLGTDTADYQIVRRWLASGAPASA